MRKVKWTLLYGGHCKQPEKMVLSHRPWRQRILPALFSLIEHPTQGIILFDTGYSTAFFSATQTFPYRLYRYVTPVTFSEQQAAKSQLKRLGYSSKDVKFVILSHLHADHICGANDFPTATFLATRTAYDVVAHKKGLAALRNGFLPSLLPTDFLQRVQWIEHKNQIALTDDFSPFTNGYDLFEDQSIIAVDLPGHAAGQIGLFLHTVDDQTVFLVADGCWTSESYQFNQQPHWLTKLITHDAQAYQQTFRRIYQFAQQHPEVQIVPSHCLKTWNKIQADGKREAP